MSLLQHIGRRGAFLLFLAFLDFVVGISELAAPPWGLSTHQIYRPFLDVMPLAGWVAAAWIVSAACLVGALWHGARSVAFGAAELLKVCWAAVYIYGWLSGDPGMVRGYLLAAVWCVFAFIVLLISGWQENPA